jgi:dihydrodipicolinate synthase/N-acetylneuraminate lyase
MVQPTLFTDDDGVSPAQVRRLAAALREVGLGEFFHVDDITPVCDGLELPTLSKEQVRRLTNRLEDIAEGRIESRPTSSTDVTRVERERRRSVLQSVLDEELTLPVGYERPHVLAS